MLPRNTSALVLASDGKGGYSAAIVRGPFDRGAPDPLVAALQLLAAEASEGGDGIGRVAAAFGLEVLCRSCETAAVPDPERPTRCARCDRRRNT